MRILARKIPPKLIKVFAGGDGIVGKFDLDHLLGNLARPSGHLLILENY